MCHLYYYGKKDVSNARAGFYAGTAHTPANTRITATTQ
jgi:hypothetical protein